MLLSSIALKISGTLSGPDSEVFAIRSLDTASADELTILMDKRHLSDAQKTAAKAIVTSDENVGPKSKIIVKHPRKILATLLTLFNEEERRFGISPLASIDPSAKIGENVFIDAFVRINKEAIVGDNVQLFSGVYIGERSHVGTNSLLYPNVVIYKDCTLGANCIIHAGVSIGADGFGFERNDQNQWDKIPQLGKVILGDNVEIGANSCVDRGTLQNTTIGSGTKIDNLVQIGHNSHIGDHNVFSSMVAIAGSTTIGNGNMWGGQVGTAGHLNVGNQVTAMGRAGITKDIPDGAIIQGFPAQAYKQELKEQAYLRKLARAHLKED